MLNPEKLRAVTTIICHRNPTLPCADGVASALILRSALSGLEIRFMTHNEELSALPATPGMLFCDIAPPEVRAAEFRAAGAIVLDHHRTSRAVVESFGVDGVFADEKTQPGVSGAMLAFREVWLPLRYGLSDVYRERDGVEALARLAGIRDTWQRQSPEWRDACALAEALVFWPWAEWPHDAFTSARTAHMFSLGLTLLEKRERRTEEIRNSGIRSTTKKGTHVLIIPTRETSDVAELVGTDVDVVVGFGYGKSEDHLPKLMLSTRSHANFDCASFAKACGGGGHSKAAGGEILLDYDDPQPYAMIQHLIESWEEYGTTGRAGG